jgi:membrane-bound lytic murein transglycosylase MltF
MMSAFLEIRSRMNLGAERFGTEKGTSWAQATHALGVPSEHVDDSIPMQDLPSALESGRITAAVFEVHVAMPAATRDPELQLGAFVGEPGSLAWAVRKEDTALLASLDEYLNAVRRTPTWHRLVLSHFGSDAAKVLKRSRGER